jgi:hypothetical protein
MQCPYKSRLSSTTLTCWSYRNSKFQYGSCKLDRSCSDPQYFSSHNHFRNHLISFRCSISQPSTQTGAINRGTCKAELKAHVLNEQSKLMRLKYITEYLVLYHDLLQLTILNSVIVSVTSLTQNILGVYHVPPDNRSHTTTTWAVINVALSNGIVTFNIFFLSP